MKTNWGVRLFGLKNAGDMLKPFARNAAMVLAVLALPVWWLTAPISYGVYVSVSKQRLQPVTYASIFFSTLEWAFFPALLASRMFPAPTAAEVAPRPRESQPPRQ